MLTCDYIVERIDGDYALLQRIDMPEEELKTVARELLPPEIVEGSKLILAVLWRRMTGHTAELWKRSVRDESKAIGCGTYFHRLWDWDSAVLPGFMRLRIWRKRGLICSIRCWERI